MMDTFTTSSKLLDLLGTLIGFATIMLLLSLIVTSLVQLVQSILQLRGQNLAKGVAVALEDANIVKKDALTLAKKLLVRPTSSIRNVSDKKPGPYNRVTWIQPSQLKDKLLGANLQGVTEAATTLFEAKFTSIQEYLRKRFALHSRIVSVGCAALVAIILQVNALDLLRDLSVNSELRDRYVAGSEQVRAAAEQAQLNILSYQEVSDLALGQLGVLYPEVDTLIEEVSGIGDSREEIVGELRSLLEEVVPDKAGEITDKYEDLIDDLYGAQADKALDQSKKLMAQLAYFNLDIMPKGSVYYGNPENWLGLLITIVLVSLGAPFWFRALQTLSGLRDILKPKDEQGDAKQ